MRVEVPLPFRERVEGYGDLTGKQIHAAVEGSRVEDVPLSILTSTQKTVGGAMLERYSRGAGKSKDEPLVIAHDGQLFIHNGHHRITAQHQAGARSMPIRVARTDSPPRRFREQGHAGEILMIDPSAMAATHREREIQHVAEVLENGVAVIEIEGPLESKPGASYWSYFDDYESILCRFTNAIRAPEVRSVLLKIDSPGGAAAGLNECVDAMIREKKESGKPVAVYVDEGAYSAAYAIACVADRIVMPRAAGVGSIGVISMIVDWTEANKKDGIRVEVITSGKRKADGNPNVPVSSAAIKHVQRRVDSLAKIYWKLVESSRGIPRKDVQGLEADTYYGKHAVKRQLADEVGSLSLIVKMLDSGLELGLDAAVSSGSSSRTEARMDLQALAKAVEDATKAVKAAGTNAKRLAAAQAALASAQTALLSGVKAGKKVVTTETASTSSSSESGSSVHESEEELPSASASSSGSSGSSESSEEEEEEEAAAALALVRSLTGKAKVREAAGVLSAHRDAAAHATKHGERLAKIEAERTRDKIKALIAKGEKSHKITPGNRDKAKAIAKEYGVKALAAFIDAAAPAIDTSVLELSEEIGGVQVTADQKKMWTAMGIAEKDFPEMARRSARTAERLSRGENKMKRGPESV